MGQFDYLEELAPEGKSLPYTFEQLRGKPTITTLCADAEYNQALWDAQQSENDDGVQMPTGKELYAEYMLKRRAIQSKVAQRLIDHCIKGWSNVYDSEGNEVPFSKAACLEFLTKLHWRLFKPFLNWAQNAVNFIDFAVEKEALAGN